MCRKSLFKAYLFWFVLVAVILVAGCSEKPVPQHERVSYRLKWLFNISVVGDLYANEHGMFADKGLSVDIKAGGPERDAIKELEIGRAQFGVASADQGSSQSYYVKLDREIQALKQEFLELNRDLSLLEEEVLYPPDQQLVVFFSISSGTLFTPSAVNVQLDGEVLVHHEYAPSEVEALRRGGVHRLYIGRVQTGDHALEISLAGTQGAGGDFTRKTSTEFSRWRGPTYVELRVEGTGNKEEPEFRVDFW